MDCCTLALWTDLFPIAGVSGWFLLLPYIIEIPVFKYKQFRPWSDAAFRPLPITGYIVSVFFVTVIYVDMFKCL